MLSNKSATVSGVQAPRRIPTVDLVEVMITPAFLIKVEKVLATVQYVNTACGLLNLAVSTFYKWKREGAALREHAAYDRLDSRERKLVDFCNAAERGLVMGEVNDLEIITQAAQSNWRAAAWRLEHRAPNRWSVRRLNARQNRTQLKKVLLELLEELGYVDSEVEGVVQEVLADAPAENAASPQADTRAEGSLPAPAAVAAAAATAFVDLAIIDKQRAPAKRTGLDAMVNDLRDAAGGLTGPPRKSR